MKSRSDKNNLSEGQIQGNKPEQAGPGSPGLRAEQRAHTAPAVTNSPFHISPITQETSGTPQHVAPEESKHLHCPGTDGRDTEQSPAPNRNKPE